MTQKVELDVSMALSYRLSFVVSATSRREWRVDLFQRTTAAIKYEAFDVAFVAAGHAPRYGFGCGNNRPFAVGLTPGSFQYIEQL
jgi:hypothetical protein